MAPSAGVASTSTGATFVDVFCGAGGSSVGLREAGLELRLAANHSPRAIETHSTNFPGADHLCADVSNYDWRRTPSTHVAWFSPECTWHSPAGGRKRLRAQLDLFDDYVPTDAGVRSRATAFDVIRAAEVHRYPVVIVENVVEFAAWAMFDWWLDGMVKLGYQASIICVSSAHVGDETNPRAPQWRDRMYVFFVRDGMVMPDTRPRPSAWCPTCDEVVRAVQSWKPAKGARRADGRRVGKYGQQYLYRCPNPGCQHAIVEPFVLPAAAAIDWADLGTRIGDRKRPLAAATMQRIRAGARMFAAPAAAAPRDASGPEGGHLPGAFVAKAYTPRGRDEQMVKDPAAEPLGSITTSDHHELVSPPMVVPAGGTWNDDAHRLTTPLRTRTTRETDALVVPPFMVSVNHDDGPRAYLPGDRPLPTRSTKIGDGVVSPAPYLVELRNHAVPSAAAGAPISTLTAGGNIHALAVPGAFVSKHHGGLDYAAIEHMNKAIDEPLGAVVARPNMSLVIPYRRGNRATSTNEPMHALSTRESGALATADAEDLDVDDFRFRMLKPREHLNAQRFPSDYVVTGNKSEQTLQAGNAVSSNVAHWLGRLAIAALEGRRA
ncbi:MAG: DNA cytosine methyltransferase [Micrococcales bacterium]|nr:DNA cytosine methyltransferase [Micrococcales bacterium]